ncbi:MAG TPA: class I SAM-dependent methyltransferase [Candidatus Bathyarchaeia archaeon]|nr:class I SAM-dependent methyltransferase [Candidatus Bathyarchaeia archaeon]
MRALVGRVLRGCARPLGLARPPRPGREYWESRARAFGARSVLNLGHPESEYHAVTEAQRRELFPHMSRLLRGDEKLVLDFGCGPGRFTRDLAALTGGRAIGVDIVQTYLDAAPRDPRVDYRLMREGSLDLPDGCADVVWVCLVLGGIDGPLLRRSALEISRVLAARGLLFLVENTSRMRDSAHWKFRAIEQYRDLFASVALEHVHDYEDLGETISVMAGRRR